ncbi:hypothetical protein MBLNU230_g3206t1 [Neophaeotheca triangularis]
MSSVSLHPIIDNGFKKGDANKAGGKLACKCPSQSQRVVVQLGSQVAHNHACGCSKCWKPSGALFSLVAVVPKDKVSVVQNENKLRVVDPSAAIQRHACSQCGVHMYGRIENKDHPFYGLDFVHVELSDEEGWQEPQFAGFLPSLVENGMSESKMPEVKQVLSKNGLEAYDALSPPLMDVIEQASKKQSK